MTENTYNFRGREILNVFPRESIEYAMDYKHRDCDRILISYPRSGSNWIQYICDLILNNGQPVQKITQIKYRLEFVGKQVIDSQSDKKVTFIATHLPPDILTINANTRYMFAIRNPKDMIASLYYYLRDMRWISEESINDFHHFFKLYINGHNYQNYMGDYFEYVLRYWQLRDRENFAVIIYEDMIRDLRKSVIEIAQFLGPDYRDSVLAMVNIDDDYGQQSEILADRIVRMSSIGLVKTTYNNSQLIRKGVIGDWKQLFSKEESDLIDQKVANEWKGTGLELVWERDMKWES
ncbi:sulfotransferase 1C2-like [Oppia nitens]|uniref:sulfotransferase 1C2-like n=1 Tax=Oppia nitens TaxID=1686743 RepID=UPI0023DBAD9B|nr:sulfotransferase 1C2-like [Oppia nitens]